MAQRHVPPQPLDQLLPQVGGAAARFDTDATITRRCSTSSSPSTAPAATSKAAGRNLLGAEPHGVVKAIEATTGVTKWEFKEQTSSNTAMLTTATGLLFTGTRDGYVYVLDDTTGKPL